MKLTPNLNSAFELLEQKLSSKNGVLTIGDASSITGASMRDSKEVLDALVEKYDCRLKVTENGDILYDFGHAPHRRGEPTWKEWWGKTRKVLWKSFVYIFKICIAVTLVVYFSVFLIILIAIIIGLMFGSDGDSDSGAGDFFGVIGELFRAIFIFDTHNYNHSYHYSVDKEGYAYRDYDKRESALNKISKKKNKDFVASVYDFVFGPPRYDIHPLANHQEVAAYLRTQKGILVKPELIGLAGWNGKEAEEFFSDCIVRFNGEAQISENAVLYGDFQELIRSKNKEEDQKVVWYWDEYEPPYKLTGNSFWRNVGVVSMNAFNLIFAFFLMGALASGTEGVELSNSQETIALVFLAYIPLSYSAIFFMIPILRYFYLLPKQAKRNYENTRKHVMKIIFKDRKEKIALERLVEAGKSENKKHPDLTKAEIEKIMNELLYDLEGDIDLNSNNQVVYKFEKFIIALEEAEKLRANKGDQKDLGKVVFDSEG